MSDAVVADYGIRQLHARFADAVWRHDYATFADCFADDGVWKIVGQRYVGREAIAAAAATLLGRCERIQLVIGQPMLEVGEDAAIGRVQVTEFARKTDGSGAVTFGTYHDRYVDTGGAWRFAWRHWSMAYHGTPDLLGAYVTPADFGPFPAMPADDEPTFVRRG